MTNKINGIDVSEEIRYCNNCSNLGLDFKTGKFYCSLSYRPDELPEVLSCDEFSTNCYIKRLQEENKELKKQLEIDKNQINYFIEENEGLKKEKEKIEEDAEYFLNGDYCDEKCNSAKNELNYKSALEEIRKWATNHNPCDIGADINCTKEDCFNCLNYDIKKITKIIDEVLNDRD